MTEVTGSFTARDVATWPVVGRVKVRWPEQWRRSVRFLRFGLVGASGIVVNEGTLAFAKEGLHLNYIVGVIIATQLSSIWNFALIEWWAFRGGDRHHAIGHRIWMFFALNNVALLVRGPMIVGLTEGLGVNYLISNLISLLFLIVARFGLSDTLIWKPADPQAGPGRAAAKTAPPK